MSNEFYCGRCGKFKTTDLRRSNPTGTRPICSLCKENQAKLKNDASRVEKEASRDRKRARDAQRTTVKHLMYFAEKPDLDLVDWRLE